MTWKFVFYTGAKKRPTKHFEVSSDAVEVTRVCQHFIRIIGDIKNNRWKHFGTCLKRMKSITGRTDKQGPLLTDAAMPNQLKNDKKELRKQMNKYMEKLKELVEDTKGQPYMNEYRHFWNQERVPAHSWAEEEKNMEDMSESEEHDSGELEDETSDDGEMAGRPIEYDDESSDSD